VVSNNPQYLKQNSLTCRKGKEEGYDYIIRGDIRMTLTFDYIKKCKNKNLIFQEAVTLIQDWSVGLEETSDSKKRELLALEEEYQIAINNIDIIANEMLKEIEKSSELLRECKKKQEKLKEEKKQILKGKLAENENAYNEKQEEIRFLKHHIKSSIWDKNNEKEIEKKIQKLEEEIRKSDQRVLDIRDEYDKKISKLQDEEKKKGKEIYQYVQMDKEIMLQLQKEKYEKEKRQILVSLSEDEKIEELLARVIPENLKKLENSLRIFDLNNKVVVEKRGRIEYVVVGTLQISLPVMPDFYKEKIKDNFSFLMHKENFYCPYSVSRYSSWNMPGLFYQSVKKREAIEHLKSLMTAYCLTRHPMPVQIYYEENLLAEHIIPREYEKANPELLQSVVQKDMEAVLEDFYVEAQRREAVLEKAGVDSVWEYYQRKKQLETYRVLIWSKDCYGEKEYLQYLLSKGGCLGLEVLLFQDKERLEEYQRKNIVHNLECWVQQEKGDYISAQNSKVCLSIKSLEENLWNTQNAQNYVHLVSEGLKEKTVSKGKKEGKVFYVYGKDLKKREEVLCDMLEKVLSEKQEEIFYFNFMENSSDYQFDDGRSKGMKNSNKLHYISPDILEKGMQILKHHFELSTGKLFVICSGVEYAEEYPCYSENEKNNITTLWKEIKECWRPKDTLVIFADSIEVGRRFGTLSGAISEEINTDYEKVVPHFHEDVKIKELKSVENLSECYENGQGTVKCKRREGGYWIIEDLIFYIELKHDDGFILIPVPNEVDIREAIDLIEKAMREVAELDEEEITDLVNNILKRLKGVVPTEEDNALKVHKENIRKICKAEEKREFDVELTEVGPKKVLVNKVVREVTGLGIKEAKDVIDSVPNILKRAVSKEEADEFKSKLEAEGAKVTIKLTKR